MRYEIIKDKEDMYVLVINSIVVLISRDITVITGEIERDVANRKESPRRVYQPAIIDDTVVKLEDKPQDRSLGSLFNI